MKIAIIDNYDSFVYNLVRYVREEEGVETTVYRNDQIDFNALKSCDGILLSPGPGIPNEAGALMRVLSDFAQSKPIFGVCLGHQAIAEYFGNSLEQSIRPLHGKASFVSKIGTSTLLHNLPDTFEVGRYHSWNVSGNLQESLKITAKSEDGIMAIEHENLPIYGVQFHPESILTPHGRQIVQNWIEIVRNSKSQIFI